MIVDLKDRQADAVTPFIIVNFSHHEHLHLPKNHVVAFAEKDSNEGGSFGNMYHGTTGKRNPPKLDTIQEMTRKDERILRKSVRDEKG